MENKRFKVLILGGGSGGISVAARLAKTLPPTSLAIIEPSESHYYQPGWTMVGGGIFSKESTHRHEKDLIPFGCAWIKESVAQVFPQENRVRLASGGDVFYDFLVVATGLKLNWDSIRGLQGQLGKNGICTIYDFDQSEKVHEMLRAFKGGTAIFIMPPVPIKCAGAPQKIMYLADDIFRENGVREKSTVIFTTPGKAIFGVPQYAKPLSEVAKRKGIDVRYLRKLVEVRAEERLAIFDKTIEIPQADGTLKTEVQKEEVRFDLLHVVPPMSAHDYVANSGLAFNEGPQKGWLKVHQQTLQHLDYANIFGVGDVTGVPNSKTAAAIRKQAPLVVKNLLEVMNGQKATGLYDGYSSCPLVTGKGRLILAEFGYDGKLMETFPFDQSKERYSMWLLKCHVLPKLYWQGMLKGRA